METTLDDLHCPVFSIDIFVKAEGHIIVHGRLRYVGVGLMDLGVGKSFPWDYRLIYHHVLEQAFA
jgi:hypothetical protein